MKKTLTIKDKILCGALSIISGFLSVIVLVQLLSSVHVVLNLIGIRFLTWQAIEMISVIIGGMVCFTFLIVIYEIYSHALKQGKLLKRFLRINAIVIACIFIEYLLIIIGNGTVSLLSNIILLSALGLTSLAVMATSFIKKKTI